MDNKQNIRNINLYKLIDTFDFEPIILNEDDYDEICLRVEVLKNLSDKKYFVRLYLKEKYHVIPSDMINEHDPKSDFLFYEPIFSEYSAVTYWQEISGLSKEDVLNQLFNEIEKHVYVKICRPQIF